MKKTFALVMILVLAILGLTGCGGSKENQATPAVKPTPTQLVLYSGRNEKLMKPVIEAFEKESGIKVTLSL